ncbi:GMC oxidoreductase [Synechococcus sp. KORDI-52]|uniref:GMC oxidoreductase n=1 Tax=Synechococcus sp. KORDI-52 TaxID=585425 RepID=UPI0004E0AD3B|nr:GMC family oxidoreductase [Synechococcus sp. KORDI-52]AII48959.1 GMC oxidoreductase [Synechococcus sp. KORDI-52]
MSRCSLNCDGPWDAIVVGSGASGGIAAMTLAEGGARVLVVEAGPDLTRAQAFGSEPGNLLRRIAGLTSGSHRRQSQHPGYWKANPRLYADERTHPYEHPKDQPFLWTRGLQVGGRSLTWGGITLRLSDQDLAGVELDGEQVGWPLRSRDLTPHYGELERWLGVHGGHDGLDHLPDGDTQPALAATSAEQRFAEAVRKRLGYPVIRSRGFGPAPQQGQDPAWPRSSSRGSSLPRALATGRVQLLSEHVVERLLMDTGGDKATGVVAIDQANGSRKELRADLVVLAASTIQTLSILLRSRRCEQSNGFDDPSGRLGTRLMDHVSTSQFFAFPEPESLPADQPPLTGAGSFFVPFGRHLQSADFQGGYGLWGGIGRFDPPRWLRRRPSSITGFLIGHGEVLPRADNRVTLSERTDRWGMRVPSIACRWSNNELAMVAHMRGSIKACIDAAGGEAQPIKDLFHLPLVEPFLDGAVALSEGAAPPGYYIHEVGGAAMGESEICSVVDSSNRLWRAPNVLVVDGACWPTSAWQSPTLTMMALSRRACLLALSGRGG